jgi:translation initiation factor IF-2
LSIRVFELAKELGVTSKAILAKCHAEDVELKNHMAVLSAGLEQTIREWFSESATATSAVETSQHVDLQEAREQAKRSRRRRHEAAPAAEEPPTETAVAEAVEEAAPPAEAPPAETVEVAEPAEPAVIEEPPQPIGEPPAEEAPPAPPEPQVAQVAAEAPQQVEPPAQEPPPPAPAVAAAAPKAEPPKKADVKPAGPQLVPRPAKLSGPRVVRVEKPDFIQTPPRRRPPMGPGAGAGPAAAPPPGGAAQPPRRFAGGPGVVRKVDTEEEEGKKKGPPGAKRRSPRRRGGRSADSGEGLKEWRDRDLAERSARLAAATGGSLRRHRATVGGAKHDGSPREAASKAQVEEPITVKALSAATGIKSAELIRKMMELGMLATINQVIDREMAQTLVSDYDIELEIKRDQTGEEQLEAYVAQRPKGDMVSRAPVVTFLGHVDHGKTSLLDRIRNESVAAGEAGGITQHIGAYRYDVGGKHVVFLDTPGHEAFTAMRARGANMTDVVVLVVAADDGVMPQTIEALSHAKAAKVPIVVALNKIDVPNANIQRALGQLAEHGLQPREWGGTVEVIKTSAHTGEGIDSLVETLSLEAELLELKADPAAPAMGYVIEAKMDSGLGVLARLLVRDGTLRVGDVLLAGTGYGRVRHMLDAFGRPIAEAGPSTPVEVAGLDEMPEAGDKFFMMQDLDQAGAIAEERAQKARASQLASTPVRTLEGLLSKIESGQTNELNLILKADVQGSVEALVGSLNKLNTSEVKVNILHSAVGGISAGDVMLAEASEALIIGFNVVADGSARQLAEEKGVDIRLYRIIYEAIEDIRKALEEGLAPEIRSETLGHAEVRQTFKVSRVGTIAGCYVTDGVINRNAKVRVTRNNVVVADERTLDSLKRFKDDAREVRAGLECGLKIAGFDDIKEGDVLECYQKVEVARTL